MVRSGRGPVNPEGARRARAMHNFFSRKFTKTRARASRGRYVPVSYCSTQQYTKFSAKFRILTTSMYTGTKFSTSQKITAVGAYMYALNLV